MSRTGIFKVKSRTSKKLLYRNSCTARRWEHTQRLHHVHLLGVVPDGVGVVEPAVVGVPLLAVAQGVALVGGLRQLVAVLHLHQLEVAAVALACVLLLAGLERPALHAVPAKTSWGGSFTARVSRDCSCRTQRAFEENHQRLLIGPKHQ